MTRNNTNKLRAVLLAALMVLWVFAGTMAFAGGAAAEHGVTTQVDHDETWSSANTRWQGQALYIDQGALSGNHTDWQVREWDRQASANQRMGSLVRELSFNSNNRTAIQTSNLEGDYVVTAIDDNTGSREVISTNADGNATNSSAPSSSGADDSYVEVVVQNLDTVEFASDTVDLEGSAQLDVVSNRDNYDVLITSDNLTQTALDEMVENSTTSGTDAVLVQGVNSTDSLTVWFNETEVSAGNSYTFDVSAADTTAAGSASIEVGSEVNQDASFTQASFTQERGDVAAFSLTTTEMSASDRVNLSISGAGDDYTANLEVSPNDDGEIAITMNTWTATRTNNTSHIFTATTGTINHTNSTSEVAAGDRVLDSGYYDLIVSEVDFSQPVEQDREYDLATLSIRERSTGDLTVYTAPHQKFSQFAPGDVDVINELSSQGALTESSGIAIAPTTRTPRRGDVVVHEIEVSGIYGALANQSASSDTEQLNQTINSQNITFTIEQTNPGSNADPATENFDASQHVVVADAANNTLYVIVDSDDFNDIHVGQNYQANFTLQPGYLNQFLRTSNHVATDESAGASYDIVDREAEFDMSGDKVAVEAADEQTVSGSTTVAPGTEMRVRARATGEQAFLKSAETTVAEDGTFEAVFTDDDSFEDAEVGQNFTLTIRRQSFAEDAETAAKVRDAEQATVSLSGVTATEGEEVSSITVDSVFLPQGGFVTIHDGSLLDGATFDSVRGTSAYLSEGESSDVEVSLDTPYTEDGEAIAMPHQDTNGNEAYDFVSSEGADDSPYTDDNGDAITDSASVTFEPEATPTPTATATEEPTETATATDDADDQAGFGAIVALIALLGAALLAARRNAF